MSQNIRQDGESQWNANQSMGGNRIYQLGDAIDDNDAINYGQYKALVEDRSSLQTISGSISPNESVVLIIEELDGAYEYESGKYIVTLSNSVNQSYSASEISFSIAQDDAYITEYAYVGHIFNYTIETLKVNGDIHIIATNVGIETIEYELLYLGLT